MWPQGVCWLNDETGVREVRGGRVRDPANAAGDPVSAHLRERSGEPFRRTSRGEAGGVTEAGDAGPSMHSGSRSGQRFRQRRCRWTRAPLSALGWINLPTLLLRFASFGRAALHASVTRRAESYGFHRRMVSLHRSRVRVRGKADDRERRGSDDPRGLDDEPGCDHEVPRSPWTLEISGRGRDGIDADIPAIPIRCPDGAWQPDPCHIPGAHDPRPRTNKGH